MTIQEILEAHARVTDIGPVCGGKCTCGHDLDDDDRVMPWTLPDVQAAHRAHLAEVLDKHMQEREAKAKATGYTEAADALHSEARWQYDRHTRHMPGAQIVAGRMKVLGKVARNRAAQYMKDTP